MEFIMTSNASFSTSSIIKSEAFKTLKKLGLAYVEEEKMIRYGTQLIDVVIPTENRIGTRGMPYEISVQGMSSVRSFAFGRVCFRALLKSPVIRAKAKKVRKEYAVINLSPKNLVYLGIIGGNAATGALATPLIATIVGAVTTVIMMYLPFRPIFKLSPDYALFFSYLSATNYNKSPVSSVVELKEKFEKGYKSFMSSEYPNIKLTISFDDIYSQLFNCGILYIHKDQTIRIKSTFKLANMNISFKKANA